MNQEAPLVQSKLFISRDGSEGALIKAKSLALYDLNNTGDEQISQLFSFKEQPSSVEWAPLPLHAMILGFEGGHALRLIT